MAETSGFFNAEMIEYDGSTTYDRIYYADQFAYYFSKFISNGVYINPATQLKVTSKGELKLNVAVGDAFINGYWYKNDENFELQLAQANGSLPRIDRVVLRLDSFTRYINLAILQGNPAATPSAKNLTRNADAWELGLADVYIERGVLSISDANITDLRPDRTYCGYVAGVVNQIDTTNLFAQFTDAFEQYYEKQVTTSDKFSSDLAKKYNDYAVLAETNFGKWMTDTKGDFDTWYETIQAMLSDEEAVKLANQIAELKKQFQLLALRGLKTDLFEMASNDGSVFTENAQNAYVFLKQIYGKSELVNDAFISVGESGTLEFDSVDATNENVSSAKLTTGMPLRGFIIDDVSVANYTDANGKHWLCDSIELSVDGYWYCIKRVGSILSYNSEDVGTIYKTATGTLDEGKQVLYKLSDYVVSKLTDKEQSQLSELLSYGGGKLPAVTGSNAAEAIQLHVEQNVTDENGVHNIRFRNGSLQYKEGNEWKNIAINIAMQVDDALSPTSTNPVQNKVVTEYIDARKSSVGQNLITYPYDGTKGDSNGITWTVNEDGSVTANGTASKETPYSLIYPFSLSTLKSLQLGYTYTISDGLTDEQHANIGYTQIVRFDENNPTIFKYGVSSIKGTETYTANNKNTLKYGIRLIIRKGANADNITFKPMLEIGSIAHMYQPTTLSNPTLKKKIESALQPEIIVNNQTTTVAGFALDARQANPNIDGTLAKQLSDLNGSLKVYEMKTLSIVDSNFATGNRCACILIQKRWILLNGEIDVDFTNVKNYIVYTALKSPVLPLFNTAFTAIDEDGMGYTGVFFADGRITIAVRSYIPESKKQILRFSCIAFASI